VNILHLVWRSEQVKATGPICFCLSQWLY